MLEINTISNVNYGTIRILKFWGINAIDFDLKDS